MFARHKHCYSFFKDYSIAENLDSFSEIFLPSIVLGELYFGAYRSSNPKKHLDQIGAFYLNCTLLSVEAETSKVYGRIKAVLMAKGKPIPENDIWIAAMALHYNLPLYTTDKHFKEIAGIVLV